VAHISPRRAIIQQLPGYTKFAMPAPALED